MKNTKTIYKTVLTIAGSDSGGCAGIQADIKSISANGAFATTAITAITSQNTVGVNSIYPIPSSEIKNQIVAVLSDINIGAIKIGMLQSAEIIEAVLETLEAYKDLPIVLDPVMVASSGHNLLDNSALEALKLLLPMATLITPNLPEAQVLLNIDVISPENMPEIAEEIGKTYKTSVLLKGGHIENSKTLVDVLYNYQTNTLHNFSKTQVNTKNTHGTGCTLSSAIATHLALGNKLKDAVQKGITYTHQAIVAGKRKELGKGNGPVDHFYKLY
ncbi:bifunctional hydroxymethylpyrimidine kinase/phosphomethylpyrimidine kinase [Cellulophaga sp. 20_2_10]|uniref:bifunctional hydroxymethylpyrimidine kinase/phosphomethylpyrimidine kinase n=1 Tax=Cellulophaga sp. 20_2_10 TaxID=2942476 RepID=UPI00201A6FF2|nr:bifunctional hydroxymethylpyrimidine kinase/phosphomethylpyrimidine kinase [Cellulophaga sp. 20_2_10]MCL5244437.1 bifunctional hydroxymethylpyrimidine kinase/phosphomethylpyrimidine kinase [Cellulophaga sp. 20_2_10]